MAKVQNICVFCGSSMRVDPVYHAAATDMGRRIGEAGMNLVYGGGKVGLMGLAAEAALNAGAKVTGIIPDFLESREVGFHEIQELVVTDNMHDRKRLMYERSDAFVILPGGLGTLDETFEVLTWTQLGLSQKPVVIVNTNGFWSPLVTLIQHTVDSGFAQPKNLEMFQVVETTDAVIPALSEMDVSEQAPDGKWI